MSKKIDADLPGRAFTPAAPAGGSQQALGSGSPAPRLLIALGGAQESEGLAERARQQGFQVELLAADRPAREVLLSGGPWDALLADPALGGDELLEAAALAPGAPAVLLIAGFGTIGDAVDAIRRGAFDYLSRPLSPEHVMVSLQRALDQRRLSSENRRLRRTLGEECSLGRIRSRDPRMHRIAQLVESVADTSANVLINGESGTGKTMLARTIHAMSSRRDAPFVVINCGALPGSLLESELFGHARGAFTGAVRDKPGLVETAEGGTLFLDEVSSASLELQVKLLRVIQERAFERVGDPRTRSVDVRMVFATNRHLLEEIAAGRFREDLYYRIHVVSLELPPLRDRPGDIPLLARTFLERYAERHGRDVHDLRGDALRDLCSAAWPGNVRQLENCIERAVLLARSTEITPEDLDLGPRRDGQTPPQPAFERAEPATEGPGGRGAWGAWDPTSWLSEGLTLKQALEEPERLVIRHALELNGGSRQETARMLGVNRTTLFNKMRRLGLYDDFPDPTGGPAGSSR